MDYLKIQIELIELLKHKYKLKGNLVYTIFETYGVLHYIKRNYKLLERLSKPLLIEKIEKYLTLKGFRINDIKGFRG